MLGGVFNETLVLDTLFNLLKVISYIIKNKVRLVISQLDLVLFVSSSLQTNFAVQTRCISTCLREESRTPGV